MASSGKEWSNLVARHNSGTYSEPTFLFDSFPTQHNKDNQYMVIDYKLFRPKEPLPDNLLWVVEQIPNLVLFDDQTEFLRYAG